MRSINEKLERVRKPRVHIKYEVETEEGIVEKELPFVVGVMGDFSGNHPGQEKPSLKDRKFIAIDKDNFNQVMQRLSPGVSLRVDNTLSEDGTELAVDLQFKQLEDFEPTQIAEQVPALKKLLDSRNKLRELLTKSDRSDTLETILERTLQDDDALNRLAIELGLQNTNNSQQGE